MSLISIMKKSIIRLFKNSPASSGFLLLLAAFHLAGVKKLQTPLQEKKEVLIFIFVYLCIMAIWVFIVPKIEPQKKEKVTWCVVGLSVLLVTILAKIFIL